MYAEAQIKLIADTLLPDFIPKNSEEKELTFHFTIPPNKSYKVYYQKNIKNEWDFIRFEPVES
uniref:hypothetical protein n=1 Tax=Pedobacter schmidteae TaxID=2201271 RepID=UPI000EB5D2BA|nr:hypothetical protein [Pedobacter schmidteae]